MRSHKISQLQWTQDSHLGGHSPETPVLRSLTTLPISIHNALWLVTGSPSDQPVVISSFLPRTVSVCHFPPPRGGEWGKRGEGNRFQVVLIDYKVNCVGYQTSNTETRTQITKVSPPKGYGLEPLSGTKPYPPCPKCEDRPRNHCTE